MPPCLRTLGREDYICNKLDELTKAEVAGVSSETITGAIAIVAAIWNGYKECRERSDQGNGRETLGNIWSTATKTPVSE